MNLTIHRPHCGNLGNSLSHSFDKNFVKVMVLLNKLLKSWFDEIFFRWEKISCFSTQCTMTTKLYTFSSELKLISRKSEKIHKNLNWESPNHSVEITEIYSHWKNISWNQLFSNLFSKTVTFTKYLLNKNSRNLHTVSVQPNP